MGDQRGVADKFELLSMRADVKAWFERYEFFTLANNILVEVPVLAEDNTNADERVLAVRKNLAVFVNKCDSEIYKLLKSLASPHDLSRMSYEECKELLVKHLAPTPTKFAQRHKFRKSKQGEDTAAEFVSRLRTIANDCEFGASYDESILDQLLSGLNDEKLVSELLAKTELTLATAVEKIINKEQTKKEAQTMAMGGAGSSGVNSVKPTFNRTINKPYPYEKSGGKKDTSSYGGKRQLRCKRCGLKGHEASKCDVKCFKCSKVGHIGKNCRTKKSKPVNNVQQSELEFANEIDGFDQQCLNVLGEELEYHECNRIESVCESANLVHDKRLTKSDKNECAKCLHEACTCLIPLLLHENLVDLNNADFEVSNSNLINNAETCIDLPYSDFQWGYSNNDICPRVNVVSVNKPTIDVLVNGNPLYMEFDSGSAISVVSSRVYKSCGLSCLTLTPSSTTLKVANGQQTTVKGFAMVDVVLNDRSETQLQLFVADNFPCLFGRPWIERFFGENWLQKLFNAQGVNTVDSGKKYPDDCTRLDQCRSVQELKSSEVFEPGLGLVKDVEARLVMKDEAKPIMLKARNLPYAVRDKVESELEAMVESGILSKIEDSPWGTPLVPVKKDGGESVRICGDYKSTVNKCLSTRQYPLPTIDECFHAVKGGKKFSKIDIKKAYNNLLIREEDRVMTTLNTHKGLFRWNRLPYGISSSAGIFQSVMDDTLRGIPMTCCRIDDILVSGKNDEEHLVNINNVITRLERRGFKCKIEKSCFMEPEVIYLGHQVSAEGVRPVQSKVDSLAAAPEPGNVDELISFLGAVNYYRRYLPNLSSVIAPLDKLRGKGVPWKWSKEEREAFSKLKSLLCSESVLTFYDPRLPLKLDCDASKSGIGAVLSHIMLDGSEKPIEYVSRTLSSAEKNYAQIDREALAIIWAIKRLHIYLYGRKFRLVTDHKALVRIFGDKPIPEMTASRITRWALFLMNYQFTIEYRNTKDHANCDMLSRLPKRVAPTVETRDICNEIFAVMVSETMLDSKVVALETKKDPILSKVLDYTLNGWPKQLKCEGDLQAYWRRRDELTVEMGCVTWGSRVAIPTKLRDYVMGVLHSTHIGSTSMKSLARSYIYWPRLDAQIEDTARMCETCGRFGNNMPRVVDHPWSKATGPFQRVHVDYAGPFLGSMWLLLVDTYSKWPEVIQMHLNTKSGATIRAFRAVFARTGLPMTLVSDNGPQFVSQEMEEYLMSNGIKHITVPTYSPKSNGLCERFVQTFKNAMKKMNESCKDINKNLYEFLLTYRNTPHTTTGQAPAVLSYNRTLRFSLQQIKPADSLKIQELQPEKLQQVLTQKTREFVKDQPVYVKMNDDSLWEPAQVVKRYGSGSNNYEILCRGRHVKKHADALKERHLPVLGKEDVKEREEKPLHVEPWKEPVLQQLDAEKGSALDGVPATPEAAARGSEPASKVSESVSPVPASESVSEASPSVPFVRPSRASKTIALQRIKDMV